MGSATPAGVRQPVPNGKCLAYVPTLEAAFYASILAPTHCRGSGDSWKDSEALRFRQCCSGTVGPRASTTQPRYERAGGDEADRHLPMVQPVERFRFHHARRRTGGLVCAPSARTPPLWLSVAKQLLHPFLPARTLSCCVGPIRIAVWAKRARFGQQRTDLLRALSRPWWTRLIRTSAVRTQV